MGKIVEKITNNNEYFGIACYDDTGTIQYLDKNGLYYDFSYELSGNEIPAILEKLKTIVPYKCFAVKVTESYKAERIRL